MIALVILARPADTETIEGLKRLTGDLFSVLCNILTGMFWVCSAVMEHNSECIRALEKRVIQLEDQCITDIDEGDIQKRNLQILIKDSIQLLSCIKKMELLIRTMTKAMS